MSLLIGFLTGGMYMPAQQQHAAQQPPQQQMWAAGPLPNGMMSGNAAMMNPQSGMGMMPLPPTPNLMCGGQQVIVFTLCVF